MRSPETVTISTEPATIATTGCNVIVTATPVSETKYFDKVTWEQIKVSAEKTNRTAAKTKAKQRSPEAF